MHFINPLTTYWFYIQNDGVISNMFTPIYINNFWEVKLFLDKGQNQYRVWWRPLAYLNMGVNNNLTESQRIAKAIQLNLD